MTNSIKNKIKGAYGSYKEMASEAEEAENKNQGYYDFVPSAVAVLEKPPAHHYRVVSWLIMAFFTIALLWLILAKVDIVVSAQGKIVPTGKVKVIQSGDDGIVKKIYVRDGQIVQKGDALIEMDGTNSSADEQQLQLNIVKSRLTVQRLKNELGVSSAVLGDGLNASEADLSSQKELLISNKEMFQQLLAQTQNELNQAKSAVDSARSDVSKLHTKIRHLKKRYEDRVSQAERGLVAGQEVDDVQFNLQTAQKELQGARAKLKQAQASEKTALEKSDATHSEHNSNLYKELSEAEHELKSFEQELRKVEERVALQVLRSPVNGVVQQLTVNTIGGYITRAEKLLVIVPENTQMELDALILNKDIGFVTQDQPARVKVDAFEYTRYGYLKGDLQWVGSDAIVDEKMGPVYPARIALNESTLPNKVHGRIAKVVPGMSASVDIVIGRRRLIQYFIGPLLRYKDESLRER